MVARRAHNPKVVGSNPTPATIINRALRLFFLLDWVDMRVFEDMRCFLQECVEACDGLRLYGCEMIPNQKNNTLRIFIDAGDRQVTADDCHQVGQQIRTQAAVSFPSVLTYTIEVSSPGLDRILFSLEHCKQHIGKRVKCKTKRSVQGRRNYTGQMVDVQGSTITLSVDQCNLDISWEDIEKIRLIYEPEQTL